MAGKKTRVVVSRVGFAKFFAWVSTLANPEKIGIDLYADKLEEIEGVDFERQTVLRAIKDCGIKLKSEERPLPLAQRVAELEAIVDKMREQINKLEANS